MKSKTPNIISKKFKFACILSSSILASAAPSFATSDHPSIYMGGTIGRAEINSDDFSDESDTTYTGFAGIQFNSLLGVEAGYTKLGESNNAFFSSETDGIEISGVIYPINTDQFELYGRGGMFYWETDVDSDLASFSRDGEEFFIAIGSNIYLNKSSALRIEYTRYKYELENDEVSQLSEGEEFNVNTLNVGVTFNF